MAPPMRALLLALPLLLAACQEEPENIQSRAENQSRALEQRYRELEAEAQNDVAAQVAPLDNEADSLLNQMNAAEPAENEAVNGA
jgi:starvation-inducible outer membrane lipoprotein